MTRDLRESIRDLLDNAAPKMAGWLDAVAEDNPGKALELVLRAAEYALPKLTRAEVKHGLGLEALIAGVTERIDDRAGLSSSSRSSRGMAPTRVANGDAALLEVER
ncbi:MAG: hypothetical protein QM769_12080 [Pseudoxanthomonas sp.]